MTQQLTREQLEFARSIGAVFCIDKGIRPNDDLTNGELGKPGFVYREKWVEWQHHDYGVSDSVSIPENRFEIDFSPLDELEPEYVPRAGEECLCCWNSAPELYYKVKVICTEGDSIIFRWLEGDNEGCLGENKQEFFAGCMIFKPLPDPAHQRREELLEKWRGQSLEHAHDTEKTLASLGQVFDFIAELEGD